MNHSINLAKPEELAYWSQLLKVSPIQLLKAARATGSNLLHRMVYYLKAEGMLPFHFDVDKLMPRLKG